MRPWRRVALATGAILSVLGVAAGAVHTDDAPAVTDRTAGADAAAPGAATGDLGLPDGGVIRLRLDGTSPSTPGAQNWFRYDAPDGAGGYEPGTPAPVTVRQCAATTSGVMTATAQPRAGKLGLVDTGLGVGVGGEGNGAPCGRVDGLVQALVLEPALDDPDLLMDSAELDIEGKFGVTVRAEMYREGDLQATATLPTGGSDSGPDSADGDNFRWRLPSEDGPAVYFDRLVLRVDPSTPAGGFSLEGGGDGTLAHPGGLGATLGTTDTLFHLVETDGLLDCGDHVTAGGDGTPAAALDRLANLAGDEADCRTVPYVLRTGVEGDTQTVLLGKDLGDQADLVPAFSLVIAWEPEPAAYPVARTTMIDSGSGPQPMVWCDGTPEAPSRPDGQAWCLVGQTSAPAGDGLIAVTETLYGAGDPRFLR